MQNGDVKYVGFWRRFGASLIDTVWMLLIILPLGFLVYGRDYFDAEKVGFVAGPADILISWVLPAVMVIAFWMARQATPGKMIVSAKIIDAKSGGAPSPGQLVGRYLAYYLAILPLGLGLLWVAFDSKKQGWHDKLAGTLVVDSR